MLVDTLGSVEARLGLAFVNGQIALLASEAGLAGAGDQRAVLVGEEAHGAVEALGGAVLVAVVHRLLAVLARARLVAHAPIAVGLVDVIVALGGCVASAVHAWLCGALVGLEAEAAVGAREAGQARAHDARGRAIVEALLGALVRALVLAGGVDELAILAAEADLAHARVRAEHVEALGVVEARLRGALVHLELAVLARVAALALARVVEIHHVVHTSRAVLAHSSDRVRLATILLRRLTYEKSQSHKIHKMYVH